MIELIFSTAFAVLFIGFYAVAFKILPGEKWQIFAAIPMYKTGENSWQGVNITFYGILTATGYTIALAVFFIMMASSGTTVVSVMMILILILIVFIPSAKLMAFIVERKKHTITVGGAVFIMIISAPWMISAVNAISNSVHASPVSEGVFLASLITAYSIGEGFGRLACISFGCCYGRPVRDLPVFLQKFFSRFNFVFTGKTKKISYHDHLDGVEMVPVQAITAVLYTLSGFAGICLFMKGYFYTSFFLSLLVTQLWRFFSEFLRADFRGRGRISAYQIMSLLTVTYYIIYIMLTGMPHSSRPEIVYGLIFIWNPGMIIFLLVMWIGGVLYTGISSVTSSSISIYVNEDKI